VQTLSAVPATEHRLLQIYKEIEMANIKSAKKRILVNQTKALRNQMVKSQMKTVIKKFYAAVESGDKALASDMYRLAVKKVDQAVAHGILHKNNAAHKKSEFTLRYNKMA
jgi:small subunit ribosomal protein S20